MAPTTAGATTISSWAALCLAVDSSALTLRYKSALRLDFPLFSVAGNFRGSNVPESSMDQYGNTLAQWFGLSNAAADDVFPNLDRFPARVLGFLG